MFDQIKFSKSDFFRDQLILVSVLFAILTNIVLWIVLLSKFRFDSDPIPLHFSIIYGIDFVGPGTRIYEISAAGLVIWFVNLILAKVVYKKEKLFSYFLTFSSFLVQILIFIAGLSLIALI